MAVPIIIPKEGQSMETCRIVKWHKRKGDTVSQGDILCEVETDKAAIDIEAPAGGIVLDIFFEDDTEAPLLTPIAAVGKPGEEYESLRPHIQEEEIKQIQMKKTRYPGTGKPDGKKRAGISPRAKRLANQKGVSISALTGTGPEGHIVEQDVRLWLSQNIETGE